MHQQDARLRLASALLVEYILRNQDPAPVGSEELLDEGDKPPSTQGVQLPEAQHQVTGDKATAKDGMTKKPSEG